MPDRRSRARHELAAAALRAAHVGDLRTATSAFVDAIRADKSNAALRYNFAIVQEQLGEIDAAAMALSQALQLQPRFEEAARRLSRLLARYRIAEPGRLEPTGLKAALALPSIAHQPVAEAALAHVFSASHQLAEALTAAHGGPLLEAARRLVLKRTGDGLKAPLLLAALNGGVVKDPGIERVLTAVRRIIVTEAPASRLREQSLFDLILALMRQGWNTDHAWAEDPAEVAVLGGLNIERSALLAGDPDVGRRLMLAALYRPPGEILQPPIGAGECAGVRPKPLREAFVRHLELAQKEREIAAALPHLAPVADATSQRVAAQYQRNPYPRWQSLHVSKPGALKAALARYFPTDRLAFMDRPYTVLIAGAGTGQQALQSAFAYGPDARVLAIDISAPSLAYAKRQAEAFQALNVDFLVADLLDLDRLGQRFDIIECVGVLHHMADPWVGWQRLLAQLKPEGLMYIGLYSAVSRRNILALRDDPAYPGPGCSDAAAREFRANLMGRADGEPGTELLRSRDFYNLNEFRDLALHESERHVTLDEIGHFLVSNGLAFRGFTLEREVIDEFRRQQPGSLWPGRLSDWSRFEEGNPRTFDAMYRLWCERGA